MDLVIPSNIPWNSMMGEQLEEIVYWLLDELGGRDIEWRRGGRTTTTGDGGRDIEATFHTPTPDGDLQGQRWWVEVKGRAKTVEPNAVKEACNNCSCRSDVDVLVVVTNSTFSNATRDWVRDWMHSHQRTKVRLWDRTTLERLITKHPNVAVRCFPTSLSPQGSVEAMRSRFWNQMYVPSAQELRTMWGSREALVLSPEVVMALTVGEFANGDIRERSWAAAVPLQDLAGLILVLVLNFAYLHFRAQRLGVPTRPLRKAAAYVLGVILVRLPLDTATELVENAWQYGANRTNIPTDVQEWAPRRIVGELFEDAFDACILDCRRVSAGKPTQKHHPGVERSYWSAFDRSTPSFHIPQSGKTDSSSLIIELNDAECRAGLALSPSVRCPFVSCDAAEQPIPDLLRELKAVLEARIRQL